VFREARCILCGKNERFFKLIVGKSKVRINVMNGEKGIK
jgi:hypothetical protein